MQRITYINILGERAVFSNAPPYVFESVRGTGMTGNVATAIEGVWHDGESLFDLRKGRRTVEISFHVEGTSREDMYTKRRELSGVLAKGKAFNPLTGERARLAYQNDSGEWWIYAVPESGLSFDKRVRNFNAGIPLAFRCESPFWRNMVQKQDILAFSDKGFVLPAGFPIAFGGREFRKAIHNEGQTDAPVEIEIQGQGETPEIRNHSTGAAIRLTSPLPQGHVLMIETDPARVRVTVKDPFGNSENAFGYLDPTCPLTAFTLRPGLNDIEYAPSGLAAMSRITLKWYELYEGV